MGIRSLARRRARRTAISVATSIGLLASVVGVIVAPPAYAADPGVDKIVATLGELEGWTQELGSIGKLAESLPAVPASPGAVLGFADLLQQYFDDADGHPALSAATEYSDFDFTDRAIEISGDRAGTLSSSIETLPNGDKQIELTLVAEKTVSDQALSIPIPIGGDSNAPQSAFSSQGGVDLTVTGTLTFTLVWDNVANKVHLVADETTPSFELGATAALGTLDDITAAIGILGVSVVAPSILGLSANFRASISDPNNDGRLAFEETDGSPGELAQADSLDGLVDFGFGSPAGSLTADLQLSAAPTTAALTLPAISARIEVDWPDISMGVPSVTPTGIDTAGKFLNMTPRDIADGLGQLVTSLTSIQRSGIDNLELPFVKGTLADAVKINEILTEFLDDNTTSAEDDPAAGGNPTFVSLQEFFDRIDAAEFDLGPDATLDISDIDFIGDKLDFTLSLGRDATAPVSLNAAGAAASGGAGSTYGSGSLTDLSQDWVVDEFAGHHVVAGSSAGTIASNTATGLTLDSNGWTPTVPVSGSPYTISGMQGDVGTVQLGDSLLDGGSGVREANAVNATAQVTPSYEASVTLVLDLQPPTLHDPPLELHNPDGSAILVSATPIGADRVLLRTADTNLFRANFPIDATVDLFANAGFLQVQLVGAAHVCQINAGDECDGAPGESDHMLEVNLKDSGDLNFGEVVSMLLSNPGDLLDFDVNVRAFGEVDASVPGTTDFFPGATAHAEFSWADLRETTGPDGPQFDVSDLSELAAFDFDPSNPQALFSIILKTLQTLNAALGDADPSGASVFNEEIPLVGQSLSDLLRSDESGSGAPVTYGSKTLVDSSRSAANGNAFPASLVGRSVVAGTQVGIVTTVSASTLTMASNWASKPADGTPYMLRSELDDLISILESSPSDNLQELVRLLDDRLAGTPISFEYQVLDSVPSLVIRLDWQRSYNTSAPVQLDFNLPIGDYEVAGVEGNGSVALSTSGGINLGLVVPLQAGDGPANADALKVLDDSSIGVRLDASIEDAHLATTIGPLKLSLGDPTDEATDKATAKASYSIDLAKSGATGAASTFSDFLDDVGADLNQNSDAVDCGFGGSTDLALCATLPLYVSTDGGTTYTKLIDPGDNAFNLRLPKVGTDLADHFDLAGPQIDGHDRLETPDPAELGNAILSHLIDFTQVNGIDGYLRLIEQSLNAASFGGKLPLVGEDLQQGADFVGQLRETINAALAELPAGGNMGSTQGIRDWVNDELAQQLTDAGMNPDLVRVDTECSSVLTSPTPSVTPSSTADEEGEVSHTHTYAVVSYQHTSDGDEEQAMPATGSTTTADYAAVGGGNSNTLNWTAIEGAEGYKVYRSIGGTFQLLSDVGTDTSYTDDGSDLPSATDNPTNTSGPNPKKRNCPWDEFDAVIIRLDVSQGEFDGAGTLTCPADGDPHECITESVPLDIGIPGLSLKAHDGLGPEVQLGYHLHFAFGISRDDGFFVDTDDELDGASNPVPELAVGLNFTIPGDLAAELAFINITAHNCTNAPADVELGCGEDAPATVKPLFGGTFAIDLVSDDPDGHLTIADLQGASLESLFDVTLKAEVAIDWLLKAKVGDDAGFPGIQAELRLGWSWNNEAPGANLPTIAFANVAIDAGEVFGEVLGPIVNQIKKVTGPIDPIIEMLYEPMPVLSDLSRLVGGDDVTLVSIAKAFSTIAGGPDLTFIDTVLGVVAFINNFPECTATCLIPIGDFTLSGDKAVNTSVTPANTESLIASKSVDPGVDPSANGGVGALGALDAKDSAGTGSMAGEGSQSAAAGFSFPVFENPASLFNLVLGGDVDLVKFDSGPLTLGFEWRQAFGPVYAPPPVNITLSGSASVTLRIVAGFDTYGIRKAFEKSRTEELDLGDIGNVVLQSLFFYTTEDGKPIPVVSFNGEIAAGAEVSAIVIKVGIEGGVGLTVSFLWNDPNHDGKFRISEFLQAALNNPICLFTVSGRVYVFLRAYVTLGFSPFSVTFSFTIVDVTLLDFTATPDCDPPPPELAGLSDDQTTLVVYAATLDGPRGPDYVDQDDESIKITSLHNYDVEPPVFDGVAVSMLGIRREYRNPNIERVIVDGHTYTKPMSVMFMGDGKSDDTSKTGPPPPTAQFALDAIVLGGSDVDTIKTGIGNSWVDGGAGDDIIVTGDRTILNADGSDYLRPDARAYVAGGAGDDGITVGNGDNVIAGDSALTYDSTSLSLDELINDDRESGNPAGGDGEAGATVSVPDWTTFGGPDNSETSVSPQGIDTLKVGFGDATVYGNGGNDTISVAPDSSLALSRPDFAHLFQSQGARLVGGTGDDNFAGGAHDDTIITGPDEGGLDTDPDADGGSDDGSTNTVDTGTGTDTVYGSTGADFVLAHSKPDEVANIRGGAGEDVLVGGYGQDTVFGGPDDDYVIAEPSEVGNAGPDDGFGPSRTVKHLDLPSGVEPAFKVLVGGTGDDHIVGGDGGAAIDGDGYNETDRCEPGDPVASDPVDESVNTPDDGNDKIIGGAGVENVRAGGGNDDASVKANDDLICGESGNDTLRGGADDDQAWGGSDVDVLHGDGGDDKLYGNDGNDTVYGGADDDTIEGNDGTDWVTGGAGVDVILGGTRAEDRADQGDFLFGDSGTDTIIGDNGDIVGPRWYPLDLDGATATAGGVDLIFGGSSGDDLYGGLAGDFIYGGDHADEIEGNNGSDTIFGQAGADNIIGGSSEIASGTGLAAVGRPDDGDTISGGPGDDVITGDNAIVEDDAVVGSGHPATRARSLTIERDVELLDLGYSPTAGTSGGDTINGDGSTDVIFGQGAVDTIHGDDGDDYIEGGPAGDLLFGDAGEDDIVGGGSTIQTGTVAAQTAAGQLDGDDTIEGGAGGDVAIGDNGIVRRDLAPSDLTQGRGIVERTIELYDLGDTPTANTSGSDLILGGSSEDVLLGQGLDDRIKGNNASDYLEGGPGRDWLEGNDGHDDLVGGSSTIQGTDSGDGARGQPDAADVLFGGDGDDVATGDNARVTRVEPYNPLTNRIGSDGAITERRSLRLLDLANAPDGILTTPTLPLFGGDQLSGGAGVDVLLGQDADDDISGGANDDYAEGNGDGDRIWGDLRLDLVPVALPVVAWPGSPSAGAELHGTSIIDGQDDLMGGSSRPGFRDGGDVIHGNGESDYELGDNGTIRRIIDSDEGALSDRIYAKRYGPTPPADAAAIRVSAPEYPNTRFCDVANAPTCEPAGAYGPDQLFGDAGDDTMYGQDDNDVLYGGDDDDDMYGELGNDELYGEAGDDAMLGDRGGIVDQYQDGSAAVHLEYNQVPQIVYDGFLEGSVTRIVDLQHDVNGDVFVDNAGTEITSQVVPPDKMPFDGVAFGGNDRMRGGLGHDSMHGGVGDDLVNGDSGGDIVFGDDGADVLWGGKGCDPIADTEAVSPDCWTDGAFDPAARGDDDRMVDYLLGGKGATAGPSVDPDTGNLGSDIMDWAPRGSYAPGDETQCTANPWPKTTGDKKNAVTVDPCDWFVMTEMNNAEVADNQHHQGVDWQYGGWDRDVLQADLADEGPNLGDRLLDWTGAYNLYTHCNAAYGGFNDVRQFSPDMQSFLQTWTFTLGGGLVEGDVLDSTTSAFNELALVYQADIKTNGSGKAYPSTPGHFDEPNACAP